MSIFPESFGLLASPLIPKTMIDLRQHQLTVTARPKVVRKAQLQRRRYRSPLSREYRFAWSQRGDRAFPSRSDWDAIPPKQGKIRKERREWRRRDVLVVIDSLDPSSETGRIDLGKRNPDAEGAELHIRTVGVDGIDLATVSLINNSRLPDSATRSDREAHTLFQTCIIIRPGRGTRLIPKPPRRIEVETEGDSYSDEKSSAVLFRNAHEYAVGHVCSADWALPHNTETGQPETAFVATSWVPSAHRTWRVGVGAHGVRRTGQSRSRG